MSIRALEWARTRRTGSSTRKLVLWALADRANEERGWVTYVGQQTLAAECEMSRRSVMRALADLEAVGAIRRESRRRPDGYRSSDLITLVPEWSGLAEEPDDTTSGDTESRDTESRDELSGDNRRAPQVTNDAFSGDTESQQEPEENRKKEPEERERGSTAVESVTDAVVLDHPLSPAALCEHLRQFLIRHEHRVPSVPKSWVAEMERMLRDDERDPELVRQAIDWIDAGFAAGDMTGAGFWCDKVSTPGKLRKHFGSIVTQARQAQQKQSRGSQATQRAWETSQAIRALFGDELPHDFNPLDRIAGYPPADPRW